MNEEFVKACPFCGGRVITIFGGARLFHLICNSCFSKGPRGPSSDEALIAWNQRYIVRYTDKTDDL
jgi:Lar family restriction alleviation protein